jgi:transposase
MKTKNNEEVESQFMTLRSAGLSVREIARKLGKSTNTVCLLNKKYFKEITDIKNAKLTDLQKKIFEQKKERLDYFKELLCILSQRIYKAEIMMKYQDMVELSLKISESINKCERDMLITEIINDNTPITDVIENEVSEVADNSENTQD